MRRSGRDGGDGGVRLVVEDPGLLSTVQDLGRAGHGAIGVSECGAADRLSLRIANRLVGNSDGAACLESTLKGCSLRVAGGDAVVAVCGGDAHPVVVGGDGGGVGGGHPLAMWRAVRVRAGDVIRLGAWDRGARVVLAVRGGIDAPVVLGSRAAHVPSGVGGGRLVEGSVLAVGASARGGGLAGPGEERAVWDGGRRDALMDLVRSLGSERVRFVRSAGGDEDGGGSGVEAVLRVGRDSDRIGVRLEWMGDGGARGVLGARGRDGGDGAGEGLDASEGMAPGMIQRTASGGLIVLGADSAPTGGYPMVGTVIAADLDVMGQKRPGDVVRLVEVDRATAWAAWRAREGALDAVLRSVEDGSGG
ncbi:MAG: biotin-dependent carboxyltransferase family protein [Phycisphaerales bacterium]